MMLQQQKPEDFVVATGQQFSVRDFVDETCRLLDIPLEWKGSGINEIGVDSSSGRTIVAIEPRYFRPTEVDSLLGDASKARERLGWEPKISFQELVREMVEADMELAKRNL